MEQQQGGEIVAGRSPSRQLSELPKDELEHLAEEFGIDPTAFASRQHLVAAIHDRRQAIANMDRDAMLDVVKWGRRPVAASATKEQIAQEIARIVARDVERPASAFREALLGPHDAERERDKGQGDGDSEEATTHDCRFLPPRAARRARATCSSRPRRAAA